MKLFSILSKVISDIYNSFFSNNKGMAARKLTAFVGLVLAVYETIKHTNPTNLYDILLLWLMFIAFCLGLVSFEQIMNFKSGKSETTSTSSTTTETTKTEKSNEKPEAV